MAAADQPAAAGVVEAAGAAGGPVPPRVMGVTPAGAPSVRAAVSPQAVLAASPTHAPTAEVLVDPAVSRAKFDREIARYHQVAADCRRRGWWLLDATFPDVLVAFVAPQVRPRPLVFAVRINFDNYDLWAPSVRLVDPFTGAPLRAREVPAGLTFTRMVPGQGMVEVEGVNVQLPVTSVPQPLLLSYGPDELPFICLPGIREYHEHPAHTGDDWLLHRDRGEGTLYFLLEKLSRYGLEPIKQYQLALSVVGFAGGEPPL